MTNQQIKHELLSIQALRQRRNEYIDVGNISKANQATLEAMEAVNTLQEKLGFEEWLLHNHNLLNEYGLIAHSNDGFTQLSDTHIDWCEEFRKFCNR